MNVAEEHQSLRSELAGLPVLLVVHSFLSIILEEELNEINSELHEVRPEYTEKLKMALKLRITKQETMLYLRLLRPLIAIPS